MEQIDKVRNERENKVKKDLESKGFKVELTLSKYKAGTPDFRCFKNGESEYIEVKHTLGRFLPSQIKAIFKLLNEGEKVSLAIINDSLEIKYVILDKKKFDGILNTKKEKVSCICGYEWILRVEDPVECPNCKTRDWKVNKDKAKEVF